MLTQTQETQQKQTLAKPDTYIVVMASHELNDDLLYEEGWEVPADTQILEMFYPADIKVDKAFLEKDLSGWLQHGYYLQEFMKRGTDTEF